MTHALVIGGGISGLATAWFLQRRGMPATVLEARSEVGGTIRTLERDGFLLDVGPNSTLSRGGALSELITGLGLDAEVVEADRRARRYIVKEERLVPLPEGLLSFIGTPLFSARAKVRLLTEPFRGRAAREESIGPFVRRRLGPEFLDWAADPFVSGVYAGDPERLSVRAAVPRLYALEAEYGSLFLGALGRAFRGSPGGPQPRGRLISFRRGMQTLPRAISTALGRSVRTGTPVTRLDRAADGAWIAHTPEGEHRARHLVLGVPAYRAAELLGPLAPSLKSDLDAIAYPPVASVALGFARDQVAHPLDGFGALLPGRLQRETLGVIFSSSLFPGRAPPGKVLLTGFIGGARNPSVGERAKTALAEGVLADLRPLLGLRGEPLLQHVTLWPHAIPQYELGHEERLARIDAALARLPRLAFCANWRGGVSLADCVVNAAQHAAALDNAGA